MDELLMRRDAIYVALKRAIETKEFPSFFTLIGSKIDNYLEAEIPTGRNIIKLDSLNDTGKALRMADTVCLQYPEYIKFWDISIGIYMEDGHLYIQEFIRKPAVNFTEIHTQAAWLGADMYWKPNGVMNVSADKQGEWIKFPKGKYLPVKYSINSMGDIRHLRHYFKDLDDFNQNVVSPNESIDGVSVVAHSYSDELNFFLKQNEKSIEEAVEQFERLNKQAK